MRRQSNGEGFKGTEVFVLPEIAKKVFSFGQLEVLPRVVELLRGGVKIEDGEVIPFSLSGARVPDGGSVRRKNGMISGGVLVHRDNFGISE